MSIQKIRYVTRILLLLYIGYFGSVSFFVHKHIYQGVHYIHSHPYKTDNKTGNETGNENEPPYETHQHTAAGFFTLNQLSNNTSFEANHANYIARVDKITNTQYIDPSVDIAHIYEAIIFRHRAPPCI